MILLGLVQVCMAPMMMERGLLCGSCQGCVLGGHGMVLDR